ncbi:hypothetical protein [Streptomyces sp. SAI-133]|uniref:hypothetical protein n=1 Tax=Streptomyces sp. SAI-133 TaxID=2940547 RepID=UPI0032AF1207
MSRRRALGTPSSLRGRLTLLVLLVVLAGSPWVQRPLSDYYTEKFYIELSDDKILRWLVEAAFLPRWGVSGERYGGTSALVVNDLAVLVLLAALAFLARRLWARGAAGPLRCLAAGVLAAALANLVWWGLHEAFVDDVPLAPADILAKELLRGALLFGLAAGALLALLTAGLPRTVKGAVPAPLRRWREGGLGMTTAPVHMPVGSAPGDVTRYLCAAAYVDESFAERVVEDLLADEAGAVAASPDIDLVTVVRHCLTAQELRQRRDLRLTAAFAVLAVFAPLWLVFATVLPSSAQLARGRASRATRGHHQPESRLLVGTAITAVITVLVAFAFGVLLAALPAPGFVSWLLGAYLAGVPAVLLSLATVVFAYVTVVRHDLAVDRLLRTTMTREAFARQPRPTVPRRKWMAERLAAIREAQDGNVTVYSGYTPFIGYAEAASQWSLAVPLLPAGHPMGGITRPGGPEAFTVTELVDHVRARLRATATRATADGTAADLAEVPRHPGRRGPGLRERHQHRRRRAVHQGQEPHPGRTAVGRRGPADHGAAHRSGPPLSGGPCAAVGRGRGAERVPALLDHRSDAPPALQQPRARSGARRVPHRGPAARAPLPRRAAGSAAGRRPPHRQGLLRGPVQGPAAGLLRRAAQQTDGGRAQGPGAGPGLRLRRPGERPGAGAESEVPQLLPGRGRHTDHVPGGAPHPRRDP